MTSLSPRTTGPVRAAAGPSAAALSSAPFASSTSARRPTSRGTPACSNARSARSRSASGRVARRRRRRVIEGAILRGERERSAADLPGEAEEARLVPGGGLDRADRAAQVSGAGVAGRERVERMERRGPRPGAGERRERIGAARARDVQGEVPAAAARPAASALTGLVEAIVGHRDQDHRAPAERVGVRDRRGRRRRGRRARRRADSAEPPTIAAIRWPAFCQRRPSETPARPGPTITIASRSPIDQPTEPSPRYDAVSRTSSVGSAERSAAARSLAPRAARGRGRRTCRRCPRDAASGPRSSRRRTRRAARSG